MLGHLCAAPGWASAGASDALCPVLTSVSTHAGPGHSPPMPPLSPSKPEDQARKISHDLNKHFLPWSYHTFSFSCDEREQKSEVEVVLFVSSVRLPIYNVQMHP